SPVRNRSSAYSQLSSGGVPRPASPVYKRGTLGLYSSNDVTTLSDEFGQSLGIKPKPPRHTTSSQSSGGSSGFNVHGNFSSTSVISRQPTNASTVAAGGPPNASQQQPPPPPPPQHKRNAGEADIVGKTKGGFEVVWSTTDTLSTSYVMVPVPKAASPEAPAKVLKQKHSQVATAAAADAESTGTQSQPNLKRVLESITREINLDSSYVLLLPPPPPIAMDDDDCGGTGDDEFGYLATTALRRVKSEMAMRRTLQEFEYEYGLDLVDDGGDSDSFQMVDSDGGSSRNSVYFSAEDDAMHEPETWYKRLSGSSSQHHLPQRHLRQPDAEAAVVAAAAPQPLSLNQLTLLEFFLD
ncbi:hypothetical protein H4R19_007073, partial [Coemansia spiralis]